MKVPITLIFNQLKSELNEDNKGMLTFTMAKLPITVKQNNVIGNILEEWFDNWLTKHNFDHIYNQRQCSPDFLMDIDDMNKEWLEVKSFTSSPNFDIANFMSYIDDVIIKPWKLDSKYLCIKYKMNKSTGIVTINDVWLKNIWEISNPSEQWAVKVQQKKKVIYNLRPSVWYTPKPEFINFKCLEHFLSALDYVIKNYPPTSSKGLQWREKVEKSYSAYKGITLKIPLWQDIYKIYGWKK